MKTPKKVVVSKKVSDNQLKDHERWTAFCEASKTEWDDLSPEWKDFFYVHGKSHGLTTEELNEAIDRAIGEGK